MLVTIAQAAKASGVSAKMIRYYEGIGLIKPPVRGENHYRHYGEADLRELGFIRRGRELGFSVDDIRQLLSLWRDQHRSSAEVKAIAQRHIDELDRKAAALTTMSHTLKALVDACNGDNRPDCSILEALMPHQTGESCCDP